MKVETGYGGLVAGACATVIAALIGWFTARTTTRNQLAGQVAMAQANLRSTELQAETAKGKALDDQTAWIVTELRKEIDRLNAIVTKQQEQIEKGEEHSRAQDARIDQLETQNIRMRRALESHGLEAPKP